jgi:hypothetical protein
MAPSRDDDYFIHYHKVLQFLGNNNFWNRDEARVVTDNEINRWLSHQSHQNHYATPIVPKMTTQMAPRSLVGEIKSDFATWRQEVESDFIYYEKELSKEADMICWIEGILKDKALRWHQARVRRLRKIKVTDYWEGYWHAADTQFKNEYEITEKRRKMRKL